MNHHSKYPCGFGEGRGGATKYYPGGAFRVGSALYYALVDHLGSTSLTINTNGAEVAEMRYKAWGEVRYDSGSTTLTDKTYTGQRSYVNDFGLMFYNARWVDPQLGRFAQADTIVPGGVQGYDRYAYTGNNPVNRIDPTGHTATCTQHWDSAQQKSVQDCRNMSSAEEITHLSWQVRTGTITSADALATMFSPGMFSGDAPQAHLNAVLAATKSGEFDQQFNGDFSDGGFAGQYQDGGDQVGHFLTAVAIGNRNDHYLGLATIIGHEMLSDSLGPLAQIEIGLTNPELHDVFKGGTDVGFRKIYDSGVSFPDRYGNSMADLRLSYKGYMLGKAIKAGDFKSNVEVVRWLQDNIVAHPGGSPTGPGGFLLK